MKTVMLETNMDDNISMFRDKKLTEQRAYAQRLIDENFSMVKFVVELNRKNSPEQLFRLAQDIMSNIDAGLYDEFKIGGQKIKVIAALLAIRDTFGQKEIINLPVLKHTQISEILDSSSMKM